MPKHPTTLIGSATLAAIAAARSIAEASICTDVNAMALRPDEACGALVDVLRSMLALLPDSERTPPKRRTTLQTVVKELKRHVARAAAKGPVADLAMGGIVPSRDRYKNEVTWPTNVVEPTGQSLPVEVPIRAILTGTRQCAAPTLDLSVNAYTPVLTLARQLLRTGSHPDRLIEVYRGTTLCFRVSLATAARLTVKDGSDGIPRFRLHPEHVATGSSVEPNGSTLFPLPPRAIHAPGKLVPSPAPVKRDGLADLRRLGRMRRLAEAS